MKVKPASKMHLHQDLTHSAGWHAVQTEHMTRQFFRDRGLDKLLGAATYGRHEHFLQRCNARTATAFDADRLALIRLPANASCTQESY